MSSRSGKQRENHKSNVRKRERNKKFVQDYRKGKTCLLCGALGSEHQPLQFHHTNPASKRDGVSNLVATGRTLTQIRAEIAKCVLLCDDCHRREHMTLDTRRKRV